MNVVVKNIIRDFFKTLISSFQDLLPIIGVILFFQVFIFQKVPDNIENLTIGIIILWFGLSVFLMWLKYGIFPIWEQLTESFIKTKNFFWLYIFAFLVGFGTTVAEPALFIVAQEAASISQWRIDADIMRYIISISVWSALVIGVWRIIYGFPLHYIIIFWYLLVIWITYFTPEEIIWLSYDLWWVVAADVTVPLVAALWIGLATRIKWRNPVIDWFGIIALASLTPMLFSQLYWILIYNFWDIQHIPLELIKNTGSHVIHLNPWTLINWIFNTTLNILPIVSAILFFQYIILKQKIPFSELRYIILWIIFVIFWLYGFILGLEIGIIRIGEQIAFQLTQMKDNWIIYLFAFTLWFSTTMAEPSLISIANKSAELSKWMIHPLVLRLFVALWVGIWILLGAYRIIHGDSIQNYIIIWYLITIIITYFAPRYIIPIAYDSWWVTTSTITVPLVTALWIWLASNTFGRDPMIDGFWLIAFASLFPMITVMIYGIYVEKKSKKHPKVKD